MRAGLGLVGSMPAGTCSVSDTSPPSDACRHSLTQAVACRNFHPGVTDLHAVSTQSPPSRHDRNLTSGEHLARGLIRAAPGERNRRPAAVSGAAFRPATAPDRIWPGYRGGISGHDRTVGCGPAVACRFLAAATGSPPEPAHSSPDAW